MKHAVRVCKTCIGLYQPYICLQLQCAQHANSIHVFDCASTSQPLRLCLSEDASCVKALDNEIIGGLHDSKKALCGLVLEPSAVNVLRKAGKMKALSDRLVFILHSAVPSSDARPEHDCKTAANSFHLDKIVPYQHCS